MTRMRKTRMRMDSEVLPKKQTRKMIQFCRPKQWRKHKWQMQKRWQEINVVFNNLVRNSITSTLISYRHGRKNCFYFYRGMNIVIDLNQHSLVLNNYILHQMSRRNSKEPIIEYS